MIKIVFEGNILRKYQKIYTCIKYIKKVYNIHSDNKIIDRILF